MGSPTRMGNAYRARHVLVVTKPVQVGNLAFSLIHIQPAVRVEQSHSRTVVAAVLKPAQAFQQDWISVLTTDITNNSAHINHLITLTTNEATEVTTLSTENQMVTLEPIAEFCACTLFGST